MSPASRFLRPDPAYAKAETTDEPGLVIDGEGTRFLDDGQIVLHRGVVVHVPRGVRHEAKGKLTVLTVCHELE
jgi:mannose-6-phosphate isomerase-like protein (cupin superfamily)